MTGLLAGASSDFFDSSAGFGGGGADVFNGGGTVFLWNNGVLSPSPKVNFALTSATGPEGAFGFFPVASRTLSSPNLNFKLGVSVSVWIKSPVG